MTDTRIVGYEPLLSPAALFLEQPLGDAQSQIVEATRAEVRAVLDGADDRLLVVTGPCSVHDPKAALEYAARLAELRARHAGELLIVMRVYFEKPRTVTGWKGLINDPGMDGSYDVHRGLRTARRLLLDIVGAGMPVGCEWLDPITPQYIADTVTWGAIGARTTESQVHRQLASGLSMPVGFKNRTDGNVQVAVDAVRAAAARHAFAGIDHDGTAAIQHTRGNRDCHIILRGGRQTVNYDATSVEETCKQMEKAGIRPQVMIDCSHANSLKDHTRQGLVCRDVAAQIAAGNRNIIGVMIESNLVAGAQKLLPGQPLVYGQSITDGCIDWAETHTLLAELAAAVRARRDALVSSP